jgi:hypothetical protein
MLPSAQQPPAFRAVIVALLFAAATTLAAQSPPSPPAAEEISPAAGQPAAAPEPLPAVSEILNRYIEALGGEEALRRHRSVTWKGTFSVPGQGLEGELVMKAAAPSYFRIDITAEGLGTISQGFDGTVGWGDNLMTGPTLMKDGELEMLAIESDFYADLNLTKHYPTIEVVSREAFAGEPCYKLAAKTASGLEVFPYFSIASGLQVGFEAEVPTPMGEVWVKTAIGGYKEFGGRLYPTENRQEMMGTQQVITLEEPDFTELDPSVFALPEAIKTLAGAPPPQ